MWYTLKQTTRMECGHKWPERELYDMAEKNVIQAVKIEGEYRMTEGQINFACENGIFESNSLEEHYREEERR